LRAIERFLNVEFSRDEAGHVAVWGFAMQTDHHYWFPAKRYGWGWGFPISWEGWLVFTAFFALIIAGVFLFPPAKAMGAFMAYIVVLSVVLTAVCWLKGEPPRWRWGND
jgi:hypothetical protein